MLTVLRKGNTWSVFPMCSYFCAKFGYCAPRICKAGPGRWPRQPCRFGFFFPVVLSKADLHQHLLCLLKLKPRQLNTGDLSFICCLIAGSQGLAWALILTFMSQVSLAQELWLQMAGLPEVGRICYCHGYLFYFLLPPRVPLPCVASPCVRCYLPSFRPSQNEHKYLSKSPLCLELSLPGRLKAKLPSSPSSLSHSSSARTSRITLLKIAICLLPLPCRITLVSYIIFF